MKFDIYEAVTKRIIEQLKKGNIPWQKLWEVSGFYVDGKVFACRNHLNEVDTVKLKFTIIKGE